MSIGIFAFAVSANFLDRFFGFCTKKLWFFGFGDYYGLWFLFYFAFGSRLLAKIKSSFRICHSMRFGVVPVSLRKMCASATSTACTSSLILLAVFGFDRNSFRFGGFLLFFVRFCGFLYTPMPPSKSNPCNSRYLRQLVLLI